MTETLFIGILLITVHEQKMLACPVFSELMVAPKDDCFLSQVLFKPYVE